MFKKYMSILLSICMCLEFLPINVSASSTTGSPYDSNGNYDVSQSHIVINQIYGGQTQAYSNYDFIELYNPTDKDVDLSSWSIQYISPEVEKDEFSKLNLNGTIKSNSSYLIRCAATNSTQSDLINIDRYDISWNQVISSNGCSVVLVNNQNVIDTTVYNQDNMKPYIAGYVDMLSVNGENSNKAQLYDNYETSVLSGQNESKGIRRVSFKDTDNNGTDAVLVDYSFTNSNYINYIKPRSSYDGAWKDEGMPTYKVTYECNGGSSIASEFYSLGSHAVEPSSPIKDNYTFNGWYLDQEFATLYDFNSYPTDDITLYARWTENVLFTTNYEPKGDVDAIVGSVGKVDIQGWAFDQDSLETAISINIYADDKLISTVNTDDNREDVNGLFGITGNHGFYTSITTELTGAHVITVKAVDLVTKQEYIIASKEVVIPTIESQNYTYNYEPKGDVDAIVGLVGKVNIQGWAFDQDSLESALQINIYADDTLLNTVTTDQERSDVNDLFTITGNHGFIAGVETELSGSHVITVKVVDLATEKEYTIASKEIVIPTEESKNYTYNYEPKGDIDAVIYNSGKLYVEGWAFDQDSLDTSLKICIYADDQLLTTTTTNKNRVDVNGLYGITGKHGFNTSIETDLTDSHTITIKAVDLATEKEYMIGQKTIEFTNNKTENNKLYKLIDSIPEYLETYYTKDSIEKVNNLLTEINSKTDLSEKQLDLYYDELKEAMDQLEYKTGSVPQVYVITSDDSKLSIDSGYVNSTVTVVNTEGKLYQDENIGKSGFAITSSIEKSDYEIKYTTDCSILSLGSGQLWDLKSNAIDPILLRNYSANELAKQIGLTTTEESIVELYVDGVYKGCYTLQQNVQNIYDDYGLDLSNGDFILEYMPDKTATNLSYIELGERMNFACISPAKPNEVQLSQIKEEMKYIIKGLQSGDYEQVKESIDIDSFVKYWLINVYLNPSDFDESSVYFYYKEGKLYAGILSDYNLSSGNVDSTTVYNENTNVDCIREYCNLYKYLIQYKEFKELLHSNYSDNRRLLLSYYFNGIDDLYNEYKDVIDSNFNDAKWNIQTKYISKQRKPDSTYEENLNSYKEWIFSRILSLDIYYSHILDDNYAAYGYLESCNYSNEIISIKGYAYDLDQGASSQTVEIDIDGTRIDKFETNAFREDINGQQGIIGTHGFNKDINYTLSSGNHIVSVYVLNDTQKILIGSKTICTSVSTNSIPKGNVDIIVSNTNGKVTIAGWAFDPDSSAPIVIKAYVGDICLGYLTANLQRDDVNKAYNISGYHGFNGTLECNYLNNATITIKAVDLGTQNEYVISTKKVDITSNYSSSFDSSYYIDSLTGSKDGTINISGWVYDRDASSIASKVEVYVDNTLLSTFDCNTYRTDINNQYLVSGLHGFNQSIKTNLTGTRNVTVKIIDIGTNNEITAISKSIQLAYSNNYNPKGYIDGISATGTKLSLWGWAFDQDDSSSAVDLKIYANGNYLGTLTTSTLRSDVNKAYSISGNHGYCGSLVANLTGSQTITVKAVDLGNGSEFVIGSKTITISNGSTTNCISTNYKPIGNCDSIKYLGNGKLYAGGWVFDQDALDHKVEVKVYAGKQLLGSTYTSFTRSDVNKSYNILGKHGFDLFADVDLQGTYLITVKAVDLETNNEYVISSKSIHFDLKSNSFTTKYQPVSHVDAVRILSNGQIYVGGWSFDQDDLNSNVEIKVYIGSNLIGSSKTSFERTDVNQIYSIKGVHGFDVFAKTELKGKQTIIVKAVDLGSNKEYQITSKEISIN